MGAMASKKKSWSAPLKARIDPTRLSEVNGPEATMTGPSGIDLTSPLTSLIRGWSWIRWVTSRGKSCRSTASAPPAGRAVASAQVNSREPIWRSSSFKRPEARSTRLDPNEFEHTSSARSAETCAPVDTCGRISHNRTCRPSSAACQAASLPARPPPMTIKSSAATGTSRLSPVDQGTDRVEFYHFLSELTVLSRSPC